MGPKEKERAIKEILDDSSKKSGEHEYRDHHPLSKDDKNLEAMMNKMDGIKAETVDVSDNKKAYENYKGKSALK